MDTTNPYPLSKGDLEYATRAQLLESEARDVLSNRLAAQLTLLFPQAPAEFLPSNGHFSNELGRGAGEIADAVSAASINWTTDSADDAGVDSIFTSELVRLLAVDALVTAKLALFPRINEAGQLEVEALTGYLYPIFSPTNALKVVAVLQVLPVAAGDETQYQVRRYSAGLLEIFPTVKDWKDYAAGEPTPYPQAHAQGRLPLAFLVIRRDAHRQPFGLVPECLPAFRRYAKTAVNRNAVQENAGWPERVVKSDMYRDLLLGKVQGVIKAMADAALNALKKVGPRQLKIIGTNDTYEVQDGVDLAPHMAAETSDKQALLDLLRSPDLSGGNLSGVALAERQTKARALIRDLCNAIAGLVTDTCKLASGLPGANVPEDLVASLTPRWAMDNTQRISEVGDLFSKAVLPKSVALQELQTAGFNSITDEMIQAAAAAEAADLIPDLGGGI
ncbi:hypothetical protein [Deinococcus aquatilis]|uniref:hypothetical protein n=1 Tax=Deinococcus aquatilis TaxID=519440 RepID=UPI00035CB116|nr:hypothetical protein [Deinococcus aquatilis]